MMTEQGMQEAAAALAAANGLDDATAELYAALIGDTPELAPDGRVVVRDDNGAELARVVYPTG